MKFFTLVLLITIASSAAAQNQKFGHIDLQGLIQVMPERVTAETEFNNHQSELEDVLGEMQQNYQQQLAELEKMK